MTSEINLWCDTQEDDNAILDKIESPKKVVKKSKNSKLSLQEKLEAIEREVLRILGEFKDNTVVITTKEQLHAYIDASIKNGIISIDTETNRSLDPLTCKLMGACLYTDGQKQAYVPISHINNDIGKLLDNQLTCEDLNEEFARLIKNNTSIVYHNASFDVRVIQCTCGIELTIYWDTSIGCRILNENESAKLKDQYQLHVDSNASVYDIEHLFEGVDYEQVPPWLFALYAATDPFKTLKLYYYQLSEFKKKENARLYNLFRDIEMPLVKVVKDMELRGIEIDQEYAKRLSEKYHKQVDTYQELINEELEKLKPQVDEWRLSDDATHVEAKSKDKKGNIIYTKSKSEQLEWPINLESPTQLAILLYDVLKSPVIDKKYPRGTSAEIMSQMPFTICELINKRKKVYKLVRDFVDLLPTKVNYDNRIHCNFNQCGTDTGRFSSTDPNLQQIPSHAKDVRLLFKAKDGYMICGSDYSAQEPRLTAFMSQDENMLKAYQEGKDLYAVIASLSFDKPYEECLEFHPVTHEKQVEGKERRSQAKAVLLGLEYGRGATSIGEQLGKTKAQAQEIIDRFFNAFPKVKNWIDKTHSSVKECGYVEDWYGRRRRLPNIKLPMYEIHEKDEDTNVFNPFLICENRNLKDNKKILQYKKKLNGLTYDSQIRKVINEAAKDGVIIKCNSNLIAEAERQSVNAIIQGGAATLTKLAMINIDNDEELNRLGFKLLITIHDEVLGECPKENIKQVANRLTQVMIDTAKPYMNVPMSCDAYMVKNWYSDELAAELEKELESSIKNNLTRDQAIDKIIVEHSECTKDFIRELLA